MAPSCRLPDEYAFPSPFPYFELEYTLERAEIVKQNIEMGAAAAATARFIDTVNNNRKRALLESGIHPSKKVKSFSTANQEEEEEEEEEEKAPIYPSHMKRRPVVIEVNKCIPGGVESFLCSSRNIKKKKKNKKKKKRDFLVRFSGERVPVSSLRGKHLLICAFLLPLPNLSDSYDAQVCRSMIASYPRLTELHDFEMVVAARMRDRAHFSSIEDEEATFNSFFSAFPCLAVPFSDSSSRDFICASLGLTRPDSFMSSLIVNDKQLVLRHDTDADTHFLFFGPRFFPFTKSRLDDACSELEELKIRLDPVYMELATPADKIDQVKATRTPLSLVELLGCQPSDLLWKCTAAWEDKKMCVAANIESLPLVKCNTGDESILQNRTSGSSEKVPRRLGKCAAADNENALLKCSGSNEQVLRTCSSGTGGGNDNGNNIDNDKVVSVLELSRKKLVGLYLCINGKFMATLVEVHQQCLAQGLEFEVVLVFLPFWGDFTSFVQDAKLAMKKLEISSWWVAPYNDELSRRLWGLCDRSRSDELFILDAATKAGDLEGKCMMQNFGIKAYPFTKYSLFEKKLSRLRRITLESLFNESSVDVYNVVLYDQGPPFALHVSELKGKNILLYIDEPSTKRGSDLFKMLKQCYGRIKEAYPNSEVLFVPLKCTIRVPKMPWPSLHFTASRSVLKGVFGDELVHPTILSFGEDGQLRSRRAQEHIVDGVVSDSLFADSLREEALNETYDLLSPGDGDDYD